MLNKFILTAVAVLLSSSFAQASEGVYRCRLTNPKRHQITQGSIIANATNSEVEVLGLEPVVFNQADDPTGMVYFWQKDSRQQGVLQIFQGGNLLAQRVFSNIENEALLSVTVMNGDQLQSRLSCIRAVRFDKKF